jgi:hypothetical protein
MNITRVLTHNHSPEDENKVGRVGVTSSPNLGPTPYPSTLPLIPFTFPSSRTTFTRPLYLGISTVLETQFLDNLVHPGNTFLLGSAGGQPEGCGEVKVLTY